MQLGMVGLGRMGGNMTERLRAGRPRRQDLRPARRVDRVSLEELAQQLDAPRSGLADGAGGIVDSVVSELAPHLEDGRHDRRRRQLVLRRRPAPVERAGRAGSTTSTSGRAAASGAFDRGYCLMIGGDDEAVARLTPVFEALAPGVDGRARTPGRDGDPAPEEQGWLHCGPSGAGHFVKMVHNGIEYGLMQAYVGGSERAQARERRHARARSRTPRRRRSATPTTTATSSTSRR